MVKFLLVRPCFLVCPKICFDSWSSNLVNIYEYEYLSHGRQGFVHIYTSIVIEQQKKYIIYPLPSYFFAFLVKNANFSITKATLSKIANVRNSVHLSDQWTSVSNENDQKTKIDQNTWFYIRFFPPAHSEHRMLR